MYLPILESKKNKELLLLDDNIIDIKKKTGATIDVARGLLYKKIKVLKLIEQLKKAMDDLPINNDGKKDIGKLRLKLCGFKTRTQNCFDNYNIITVNDLISYTHQELMDINHIGTVSFIEINDFLNKNGLQLKK